MAQTGNHPYALCGLATSSLDYYIFCHDRKSDRLSEKQWWHIKYSYEGDNASITRTRVTCEEVLSKARADSQRALLVYANEAATSVPPVKLSDALENFVKKDNFNWLQYYSRNDPGWHGHKADDGTVVEGDWIDNPPGYNWNSVSAKEFHEQAGSGVSSTTLTPNTEVDDDGAGVVEMQEVNGGITAWANGTLSNASSDALGAGEPMEISEDTQPEQEITQEKDVEMGEAEPIKPMENRGA
jgi:hypothetical protein